MLFACLFMVEGAQKVVDSGAVLGGNDVPEAWRTGMALKL